MLTTELLAHLYGADPENVRNNFLRNQERFIPGTHFFKLEGDELKQFKELHKPSFSGSVEISPRSKHLTLWTERGAILIRLDGA